MRLLGLVFLVIVMGSGLFYIKAQVSTATNDLHKLQMEVKKAEEDTAVLKAEWSYLNRPERLQKLAEKYLDIASPKPRQMTSVAMLGYMPGVANDEDIQSIYSSVSYVVSGSKSY